MSLHNAPPVVYPLGRSRFLGRFLFALWLAGLLSVLLWFEQTRLFDWRMLVGLVAVVGAGLAARRGWTGAAQAGQLAWDGEVWHWEPGSYQIGSAEHEVSVIADFQQALLLRLENQSGGRLWLWLERNAMPERWLDLRRAVYSPGKSSAAQLPPHDLLSAEPALSPSAAVAVSNAMHSVRRIKS
ncbi:protein YgfX [Polaromonas sp. OV174]|uniref:protein YgfX n=1 Tax=Polaromonas sp. OV174 TaxID=1855300 RepID=UPI000B83CA3F|nr:protein YgfX [Polaromonas sp. OV174]